MPLAYCKPQCFSIFLPPVPTKPSTDGQGTEGNPPHEPKVYYKEGKGTGLQSLTLCVSQM